MGRSWISRQNFVIRGGEKSTGNWLIGKCGEFSMMGNLL